MASPVLASCPFRAHDAPLVAALGEERVSYVAVVCGEGGAIGPRATDADPPGYAQALWTVGRSSRPDSLHATADDAGTG
jgi:hypothetical protein